ncbi:glycosyltransferase [Aquitalea sp. S1-19]|nr:glycosyltransferase [Aquitalea sp. S1-19]
MKHLRIAHLIDLDKVGGVETMFADFIQAPPPLGLEVEHYTIADSLNMAPRFREPVANASRLLVSPKQIGLVKLPRKPRAVRAWRRLALIRRIQPDLILVWNQFTDFGATGKKLPCPVIYYEHGMSWYSHSQHQLDCFFPYVTAAIGASRAASRMLQLKHKFEQSVAICRNPVRPGLLPSISVARKLNSDRVFRLGVAGRLVPLKAVGLLVLTVKLLLEQGVDVEAVIAGQGPEQDAIERLILSEGLADKVKLLGVVDDMPMFYNGIDLFVSTSMHETMPLVCLEAMAHGIPVVCSNIDGYPEIVADGETGFCLKPSLSIEHYRNDTNASVEFSTEVYDPKHDTLVPTKLLNPKDVADVVNFLLKSSTLYDEMSRKAIKRARSGFFYNEYLRSMYSVLRSHCRLEIEKSE